MSRLYSLASPSVPPELTELHCAVASRRAA
jgi:hypothetical protein